MSRLRSDLSASRVISEPRPGRSLRPLYFPFIDVDMPPSLYRSQPACTQFPLTHGPVKDLQARESMRYCCDEALARALHMRIPRTPATPTSGTQSLSQKSYGTTQPSHRPAHCSPCKLCGRCS